MKDDTFLQWMSKHYPHLVKRVQHYGQMMAVLGFALGLYLGIFGHLILDALPDMYAQLTTTTTPLYVVYLLTFSVAFVSFWLGRRPKHKGRK